MSSELTDFDISIISNLYKEYGFNKTQITYELIEQFKNSYVLKFYIKENQRISFSDIQFNILSERLSKILNEEHSLLVKKLEKNGNFYDSQLVDSHILKINSILSSNSYLIMHLNTKFSTIMKIIYFLLMNLSWSLFMLTRFLLMGIKSQKIKLLDQN